MLRPIITAAAAISILVGAAPSPASGPTSWTVDQKDKKFSRAEIRIHRGDTLTFVNNDAVTHNVFSSSDGFHFNLKRQAPGARAAIPFPTRGTAQVRCAFHPNMRLSVTVE